MMTRFLTRRLDQPFSRSSVRSTPTHPRGAAKLAETTQGVASVEEAVEDLERRLARYPEDRYPVQHATAHFHLGLALTHAGRLRDAERPLRESMRIFRDVDLIAESAKAATALGSVCRISGRLAEAQDLFSRAVAGFDAAGLRAELGAAQFDCGLVQRERGDVNGALGSFREATRLLSANSAQGQAASRELGTTLMLTGGAESAVEVLERSLSLARERDDSEAVGATANVLGLAYIGAGRFDEAVGALELAARAHPRSVRPAGYAMAKANLALAHERAGDNPRSRLAAAQALSVEAAPDPVKAQASAVLDRLGPGRADLLRTLERESTDRWPMLFREELPRWAAVDRDERRLAACDWIEAIVQTERANELAEQWLGALLELPPEQMECVIEAVVEALADTPPEIGEGFRATVAGSTHRFHLPQATRLQKTFETIAAEHGGPTRWS